MSLFWRLHADEYGFVLVRNVSANEQNKFTFSIIIIFIGVTTKHTVHHKQT